MSDLLKEAIADAKAVRETALQNAKMALEEAFTPQLKSMLSSKLREDEYEDDDEVDAEEGYQEDDEVGDEVEVPAEEADEFGDDEEVADEDVYDSGDDGEEMEEESLDLEAIIKELENELSEGDDEDEDAEEVEESTETSDEPVSEGEEGDDAEDDEDKEAVEEEYEIDEATITEEDDDDDEEVEESVSEDTSELSGVQAELKEYKEAVRFLKDKLHEVNILNAKLLFTNKLFKEYSLNNNQKLKVVETFDRAQTTREIKLVYSTLAEQFGDNGSIARKKSINESASSKSGSTRPSKESRKVITEEQQVANRFKKLAGLIK